MRSGERLERVVLGENGDILLNNSRILPHLMSFGLISPIYLIPFLYIVILT